MLGNFVIPEGKRKGKKLKNVSMNDLLEMKAGLHQALDDMEFAGDKPNVKLEEMYDNIVKYIDIKEK